MPDSKITALTSISTSTDPANDPLVIVDVSDTSMAATGTTKKVTLNQLLGASGTATLASATISGDLTVDTNVFKVDTTNNVVGIGTATPQQNLHVVGTGTTTIAVERSGATIAGRFEFVSGNSTNLVRCVTAKDLVFEQATGTEVYRISSTGVATWSNVGGVAGTAMTLNATGLGVGGSASARIHAIDSSGICGLFTRAAAPAAALSAAYITAPVSSGFSNNPVYGFWYQNTGISNPANECFAIRTSSTDRLYVDATGNVGISVQPSGTIYSSSETRFVVKGTATSYAGTVAVQSKGTTNAVTGFLTAGDGVNEVAIGSATNTPINFYTNDVIKATIDTSGNLILQSSATPATLTTNGQLTVNATSNTNLRFSYRGSDGVTRVANITLA